MQNLIIISTFLVLVEKNLRLCMDTGSCCNTAYSYNTIDEVFAALNLVDVKDYINER